MTATISVRVDENLKREAETLFSDLGLTMSGALTIFIHQAVREQAIPFVITREPNAVTRAAIREADAIARDPAVKGYRDLDELFEDLRA